MDPYYVSPDGRATLYHGDALAVLRHLPDAHVDAVITDPPYNSGGRTAVERKKATSKKYGANSHTRVALPDYPGDSRDQRGYAYWCALWLSEALRVTRPGGTCFLWTDWRQYPTASDALQAGGWTWRGVVVWHKPTARPQLGRFTAAAEFGLWGSRGAMDATSNPVTLPGLVQSLPVRNDQKVHFTQKPLSIMREIVRICPLGGLVLDPFAGSGTTGVAALTEGRGFIGAEITPEYTAVARERLTDLDLETPQTFDRLAFPEDGAA